MAENQVSTRVGGSEKVLFWEQVMERKPEKITFLKEVSLHFVSHMRETH